MYARTWMIVFGIAHVLMYLWLLFAKHEPIGQDDDDVSGWGTGR